MSSTPLAEHPADLDQSISQIRILGILSVFLVMLLLLFGTGEILDRSFRWHMELYVLLAVCCAVVFGWLVVATYRGLIAVQKNHKLLHRVLDKYARRTSQLQIAAQITRDASSSNNFNETLRLATQLVIERFDFYHAGIFLVDEAGDTTQAVLRASCRRNNKLDQALLDKPPLPLDGEGIISHVLRTGEAYLAPDVTTDPYYIALDELSDTCTEIAVPLQVRGQVIGVLDIQNDEVQSLDTDDLNSMQTLADLLAVVIDKAQLNAEVQAYAGELEQRVAERTQTLARERAQLNAILDSIQDGVIYIEEDQAVYANRAFTAIHGYTLEEWDTLAALLAKPDADLIAKMERQTMLRGHWEGELQLRRKDDTVFDATVMQMRVRYPDADTAGVLLVLRDVSQQKALQEQKTRFVAYASHELRTPLANLKTRLYLLRKQPHRFEDHYTIIEEVTAQMQRLVDDLLLQSRFERGMITLSRNVIDLAELLATVANIHRPDAAPHDIQINTHLPDEPVPVYIDRGRMMQVLTNLVSNAINYTPDNGQIDMRLYVDASHVYINVEDNGIGIDDAHQDSVFQPFFRADNVTVEGNGLGLNISRQIVELHGGTLNVRSELGEGSTFTVCLDRHTPAPL